jgi:hypothetical protein
VGGLLSKVGCVASGTRIAVELLQGLRALLVYRKYPSPMTMTSRIPTMMPAMTPADREDDSGPTTLTMTEAERARLVTALKAVQL